MLLSFLLTLAACARSGPEADAPTRVPVAVDAQGLRHVPGELLVRFRPGASAKAKADAHAKGRGKTKRRFKSVRDLELVTLPPGKDLTEAIKAYRSEAAVELAEPNVVYGINATPDDPSFGSLWGLHNTGQVSGSVADVDINGPLAWDLTTGAASAGVVAVIDTGTNTAHPDLAPNLWVNSLEVAGNGIDDDGNGYVDDVHGINALTRTGVVTDDNGHGTHVAGTIGARGNNATDVSGVAWSTSILTCKFLDASGSGPTSGAIECLDYLLDLKTRAVSPVNIFVSNNSWGGGHYSAALALAVERQRDADILFVAAAGNEGSDNDAVPQFPANVFSSNVISVMASNSADARASFSNYGNRTVDLAAPGVGIYSTSKDLGIQSLSGTSMAAPHVTGVAALLKAQDPSRDAKTLKNLLLASGVPTSGAGTTTLTGRRLRAADTDGRGALTCSNQGVTAFIYPIDERPVVAVGDDVAMGLMNINCGAPAGAPTLSATTGESVTLVDDGGEWDELAGDGQYWGYFQPTVAGTSTLTGPGGSSLTVDVLLPYAKASTSSGYRSISGTNLNLGDETAAVVTSPFPITFGGLSSGFTRLLVSMNGAISFSGQAAGYLSRPIPSGYYGAMVAPFWDDLLPGPSPADNVYWEVLGTAPSRELVIEWRNVHHYETRSGTNTLRFQAVFFENGSDVLFNYQDVLVGHATFDQGATAAVGIQVSSARGTQHSHLSKSLTDGASIVWNVMPTSSRPALSALTVSPGTLYEGSPATLSASLTDEDGEASGPWTLELDRSFPGWFSVDASATAAALGSVSTEVTFSDDQTVTVALRATDNTALPSLPQSTTLTILDVAPVVTEVVQTSTSATEGASTTFTASFTDPGDDGPWTVEVDPHYDGTFDVQQTQTLSSPGTASFSKSYESDGTYTLAVRVRDADGVTGSVVTRTVTVADSAPVALALTGASTFIEGTSTTLSASFTSAGGNDAPFTVEWDLDYDGTFTVDATHAHSEPGPLSITLTPADSGSRTFAYRVRDTGGSLSAVQTLSRTVAEVSPLISGGAANPSGGSEPLTVSFTVTAAAVPEDAIVRYRWDFTDDGTFDAVTSNAEATFTYLASGTFIARVRVEDEDGYSDHTYAIGVTNAAPVLDAVAEQSVSEGGTLTLQLGATDPGGDAVVYALVSGPPGLTVSSSGLLSFTPAASQCGEGGTTHTVTVRATDAEGAASTGTLDIVAHNVGPSLVSPPGLVAASEGTRMELQLVAEDPGGPSVLTFSVTSGPPGLTVDEAGLLSWTPTAAQSATVAAEYTVEALVTDDDGATDSVSFTVSAVNVPPSLSSPPTEPVAEEGSLLSFALASSDPGGPAVLVHSLVEGPAGMSVSPSGVLSWTPEKEQCAARAGTAHPVTVTVTDDDGETASIRFTVRALLLDSDDDGLHDEWEQSHGSNPSVADAGADADGDGVSNADAYAAAHGGLQYPALVATLRPVPHEKVRTGVVHLSVQNTTDGDAAQLGQTLRYEFELRATVGTTLPPLFLAVVDEDASGETTLEINVPADVVLQDDTTYYWRVRATDGTTAGPWGDVHPFFFTPENDAPSSPLIASPLAGATVGPMPTLAVDNAVDVDSDNLVYTFSLWSDAGLTGSPLLESPPVPAASPGPTSWSLSVALSDRQTYYWNVQVSDGDGALATSATGSFTVNVSNEPPGALALLSPANGTTLTNRVATLSVTNTTDPDGDAVSYLFELDTSPNFSSGGKVEALVPEGAGQTSWTTGELDEDAEYHWRVRATDGNSAGEWQTGRFKVDTFNAAPSVPTPLRPSAGAQASAPLTLVVSNALDAEGDVLTYRFRLQTAAGALVQEGVVSEGMGETHFAVTQPLEPGAEYVWQARAEDARGAVGDNSALSRFTFSTAPDTGASSTGRDETPAAPGATEGGCSTSGNASASFFGLLLGALWLRRGRPQPHGAAARTHQS